MKKNLFKFFTLCLMASIFSSTAWAVSRNTTFTGIATTVQVEENYYVFNLGTSMYLGADYQYVARASVVKNPFQQIQLLTSTEEGYYNIKQVEGFSKTKDRYIFEHENGEVWADRNEPSADGDGRTPFWTLIGQSNGIYKIKNKLALTDIFLGPVSKEERRTYANIAADNGNAEWIFISVTNGNIELFHAKEALLFEKINEVQAISGFSTELINAATAVYANPSATLVEVNAAIASLIDAQYNFSAVTTATPMACTYLIVNPQINQSAYWNDALAHQPFGWEYSTSSNSNGRFTLGEGDTMLETFAANENAVADLNFDYYQILQGIPNGYYVLTATCKNNQVQDPNGNAGLYVESGINAVFEGVTTTSDASYSTNFIQVENNTLRIGVKNKAAMSARWFTADNFQLTYYGIVSPVAIGVNKTELVLTEAATKKTFNISGTNLTDDVAISCDIAGVTLSKNSVSTAEANAGIEITVIFDPEAAGATSAYGTISLSSTEAETKTIDLITSKEENFTPKEESGNYIPDPTLTDISKFNRTSWGSWSLVSIKDEPNAAKSGAFCGKISDTERGSLETDLISTLDSNTKYVMSAWIKTYGGTFNFALTANTANTANDVVKQIDTKGEWEFIEFEFKTGENPTGTVIYFNNWDGNGATGTSAYIDNWELYKKPYVPVMIDIDESELILTEAAVEKTFNISGTNLSEDVAISCDIAGVTLSKNSVNATEANAGIEITVTFDPEAAGATSAYGTISLSSTEAETKTIDLITSKEENFTPKEESGNYIPDPTLTDISKFNRTSWGSWSLVSIKDEPDAIKSGAFCGKISDTERGSLETNLVSPLEGNTTYVMSAWIKTNGGSFNFGVTANAANASDDLVKKVDTGGEWEFIEFEFTTGENPTGTVVYFNNWDGNGATGTRAYIDNWELYEKPYIPVIIDIDLSEIIFTETAAEKTFNISGTNLSEGVEINCDIAGVTLNKNSVSAAEANAGVEITVTFNPEAAGATSAYGNIALTSTGAETKTIDLITSKEENYTPKAESGNYIPDPTLTDVSKFNVTSWGSWSLVSIKDEPDAIKSGAFCGKISDTERGSLETNLVSPLEGNTTYVMSAWIKTNGGSFNFGVTANAANASDDLVKKVDTGGEWEFIEFEFSTGENPTGTVVYFNNREGDGATGTRAYIDNWELYKKPAPPTGLESVNSENDFLVMNASGGVEIQSSSATIVNVFTVKGQLFKCLNLNEGTSFIALPTGIYIINGKKAVVL